MGAIFFFYSPAIDLTRATTTTQVVAFNLSDNKVEVISAPGAAPSRLGEGGGGKSASVIVAAACYDT